MSKVYDLINKVLEGNNLEAQNIFNEIMTDKKEAVFNEYTKEVASTYTDIVSGDAE